ncbi:helix-turn-helix transcriptional regulator [Mycobacterium asiaticum]|uniref:Transcriptional regulator n=1 Tax=Mycobacterium asiaticum TaxID=1790 RepID=A0A1A3C1T8_MYCAS|nr:helix-turn-helix transcriptional regulator [Mycobacterium asiaticum]OBI80588.1 transcriptional regulator [Mycobacterium asiaticum]
MPQGKSMEVHEAGVSLNVAELIFETRAGAELSQEQLATALGVSKADVDAWETGAESPRVDVLDRLAQLCGKRLHIAIEAD